MIAIITLVVILTISLLITRVAIIALTHTGLSRESAKFQARSAYTGVGFTTSESEKVVSNPVRRRILLLLMLLGNAGIVTGIATLIVGFTGDTDGVNSWVILAILAVGLRLLWTVAHSKWVDKKLSSLINRFLQKHTNLDATEYANLLHLAKDYLISEIGIDTDHWLCGMKLKQAKLTEEGILILGITRKDGTFLGAPRANTEIRRYDTLTIYGRIEALRQLEKKEPTHLKPKRNIKNL